MKLIEVSLIQRIVENFFQKTKSFFSSVPTQGYSSFDHYLWLYEVRHNMLDDPALQYPCDLIARSGTIISITQVIPLKIQIPDEYIGILSVYCGEKLLCQEYLKLQSEFVEKRTLVSRRIYSSTLLVLSFSRCNNYFP